MNSIITYAELREWRAEQTSLGKTVAFVPTMGALHKGHLSLVEEAKKHADAVIVSIFVNPTQFGPNEDFAKYPRRLREDLALLNTIGVDAVFTPLAQEIYPEGFATFISNDIHSSILCGASRSGHFRGVLTVVLKLFNAVRPEFACFGKKDYQQVFLIRQMCRDLLVPVTIIPCEILRESNGLAMSSRNQYLSEDELSRAGGIFAELNNASEDLRSGKILPEALDERFLNAFNSIGIELEYVELRSRETLQLAIDFNAGTQVLLTACRLGSTRLIDNLEC